MKEKMVTKIELHGMTFYAYHGVGEQERKVGNQFRVDVTLTAPLEAAMRSDRLEETINYASVYEVVREEMSVPSRLLEHVAGRILTKLKLHFPTLRKVELKVSKRNPPFGGDLPSAAFLVEAVYDD